MEGEGDTKREKWAQERTQPSKSRKVHNSRGAMWATCAYEYHVQRTREHISLVLSFLAQTRRPKVKSRQILVSKTVFILVFRVTWFRNSVGRLTSCKQHFLGSLT